MGIVNRGCYIPCQRHLLHAIELGGLVLESRMHTRLVTSLGPELVGQGVGGTIEYPKDSAAYTRGTNNVLQFVRTTTSQMIRGRGLTTRGRATCYSVLEVR